MSPPKAPRPNSTADDAASPGTAASDGDEVRIHALYGGQRADGIYRRSTKCIDIVSGPGAGCSGLKPSPATAEVIKAVNPGVSASRNGWTFWIVSQNGQALQTIR